MRKSLLGVVSAAALSLAVASAYADPVPYGNVGTAAPTVPLYAASTGNVTAYFAGASTAGHDFVRLLDLTSGTVGTYTLSSGTSTVGQMFNLGAVNQGDVLVLELVNDATNNPTSPFNTILASNPTYSADNLNHTYVSAYAGGGVFPAGTYIGFEDYLGGFDLDYNDDTFVMTNLATSPSPNAAVSPEPSSLLLMGTGLLTSFGVLRRRARS